MNAHSAWEHWSKQYRIPGTRAVPIRYDWMGVGMEGAFKAGHNAAYTTLANKRDQRIGRMESELEQAHKHATILIDLLGRDYG